MNTLEETISTLETMIVEDGMSWVDAVWEFRQITARDAVPYVTLGLKWKKLQEDTKKSKISLDCLKGC